MRAPQLVLTAAVASVLQRTPEQLLWGRLARQDRAALASFQAEGQDGRLYSINVLDGTVLLDGLPPNRLPKEIVSHRMFK